MRPALPMVLLLLLGCSEPPSGDAPARAESDEGAPSSPPAPAQVEEGPTTVRFDLVRHASRAELFHGEARVMDMGTAAGHQYTLGGWRTRTGTTRDVGGVSASLVTNVTGFFLLPIESTDRCHLSMRLRAFGDGRVTVYVDDETVGNIRLPTDGTFDTVHIDLSAERCTVAEHDLRLRVARTGSLPGLARVGVAVDWIRIGTADEADTEPPSALSSDAQLRVPAGWSLAFSFEVPEGARLRGEVDGSLEVEVERDGQPSTTLESFSGADLSPFAGEIVRLRLRARTDVSIDDAAVVTPGRGESRPTRRVRNALIYLTDTLRADHLRIYDPETRVETPGLSAWAREAATFLAGHSQENWTKPSCATLLSGLYPWEHHATSEDSQVPASVELISETLRSDGFHTGAFIANGFVSDRFGFRQGFRTYRNYVREGRRNQARFVAEDVLHWLDERPDDRAFFLYVHTIDPHVPYMPPSEDLARYDPDPYDGIVDFRRDRQLLEGIKAGRIRVNARDRVRLEALYDGEITYQDRHFASVMESLERRGLADDTIVVFTSDHGEELWDHDSVGHGHSVWEELIRVPLVIRWPGVTDGAIRIDDAVGLVDVMPTILEALGLDASEELSGRSIAGLLRGEPEDAPRPTVTGFMNGWRTIVVGHFKLIQRTTSRWQLYDLAEDPGEQRDLAGEHAIAVRYLRGLLGQTLAEVERPPAQREHEAERTVIDDETRAQLEALGYAGASRAPTDDGSE